MSRVLPITATPLQNGVKVDPVRLVTLLLCIQLNRADDNGNLLCPVADLDGSRVPLLYRDEHGRMHARFRSLADGYALKNDRVTGVSGALCDNSLGLEHIWNQPTSLFKYVQLEGKEGGGNWVNNVQELNQVLASLPLRTFLVPYGSVMYEIRVSITYGRDWSLLATETGTTSTRLRVRKWPYSIRHVVPH
jgi:hypothetical protein